MSSAQLVRTMHGAVLLVSAWSARGGRDKHRAACCGGSRVLADRPLDGYASGFRGRSSTIVYGGWVGCQAGAIVIAVAVAGMLDAIPSLPGNGMHAAAHEDSGAGEAGAAPSRAPQPWWGSRPARTTGIGFSVACLLTSAAAAVHVAAAAGRSLAATSAVAAERRWRISAAWSISSAA